MAQVPPVQGLVLRSGSRPVTLGDVTFSTEEVPAKWNIGAGQQMLTVTDLPGGGRVVQDFGNSADEVSWTAKFMGPNIWPRVQQLRAYRIAGQPIRLSWWNESYLVQIRKFDPGYTGGYNEYSISCVVIQDLNGAFAVKTLQSVDQMVSQMQSQAVVQQSGVENAEQEADEFPPQLGNQVYGQQLINLWQILDEAAPLAQNLVQFGPQIIGAAQLAVTAIQAYQATIQQTDPQYPYTIGLLASVNAIIVNVQGGAGNTSTVQNGGELFTTAALQYGDVSQAFALAQANGLVVPLLPPGAPTRIIIPPVQD